MPPIYENGFEAQSDIDRVMVALGGGANQGTWVWDAKNPAEGLKCLKLITNPTLQPYYFYFLLPVPMQNVPIRVMCTTSMNPSIVSCGIGIKMIKDHLLYIMFTRLNFHRGKIELVRTTTLPHEWEDVADIPSQITRGQNPLYPTRMWLDIDPVNLSYINFGVHAVTKPSPNLFEFLLDQIAEEPISTPDDDILYVKFDPQGSLEPTPPAVVWFDALSMDALP